MKLLHEAIRKYSSEGLSFIPVPFKSKQAIIEWKEYQDRRPNDQEIRQWFNGHDSNIAVICGKVSDNLVVLDCDSRERFQSLAGVICRNIGLDDIRDFTRITQTARGFHIWLRTKEVINSAKFPNLDVKGEGGYILAPPSVHSSGFQYQYINDRPIVKVDNLKLIGIDLEQKPEVPRNQPGWVSQLLAGVGEGQRNDSAIKLAGYFRNTLPQDVTERILLDWNTRNKPPMPERELFKVIASSYRLPEHPPITPYGYNKSIIYNSPDIASVDTERNKSVTKSVTKDSENDVTVTLPLAQRIENWVEETTGWFSYEELDKELEIRSETDKANRRNILKRLKDKGKIEYHLRNNKLLRKVNTNIRLIDFKSAGNRVPLNVKYPFGIEKYFNTFPGNIIVVAGSPDAGKTAFLLNFIYLNQYDFTIYYQSSEMGDTELASRLENFEGITLDEWNFTAEERSSNFADVIRPDCINIIDFMEITGDFYMVAEYLRQIHDKLAGGIAIVALQKDPKADQGRGGTFGLEKPRLYLNIDPGKLTIRKAKNWAKIDVNPNGLEINYKIVGGCKFVVTNNWHEREGK